MSLVKSAVDPRHHPRHYEDNGGWHQRYSKRVRELESKAKGSSRHMTDVTHARSVSDHQFMDALARRNRMVTAGKDLGWRKGPISVGDLRRTSPVASIFAGSLDKREHPSEVARQMARFSNKKVRLP